MTRLSLFLILGLLWSVAAAAQPVTTIGPVTPGDIPVYNSPTVIKDSGIPAASLTFCPGAGAFVVGTGSTVQCSTVAGSTATLNGTFTASTINGFTMGGNINGGGFQINNVNIGNTSPGAAAFTNLFATTTYLGTVNTLPSGTIVGISNNTATTIPAMTGFLPQLAIAGADGTRGEMALQTYGTGAESTYLMFGARGTMAAPTHSISGDFVGQVFAHPCAGGPPCVFDHNAGSGFVMATTEDTLTNAGQKITWWATPTGTNTVAQGGTFEASGAITVGSPTGGDCGAGCVNAAALKVNNVPVSTSPLTTASNVLSGDVAMNNVSNYFDGPSMAQGTAGTWWVSASIVVEDTAGAAAIVCKLWDGTNISASTTVNTTAANNNANFAMTAIVTNPAANMKVSCKDVTSTSGFIKFNASGNSKDSSIWGFRLS